MKSQQSGRVACGLARFGLIPAWAKDEKISRHTYNARSETVAEKPSFRTAWRKRQFCLILADNFYEPSYETGKAVRWRIQTLEPNPFAIAGIWDKWTDPATGELVVSFSMLTVNADEHEVMRQFHKPGDEKRTPVIIPQENYIQWLGADVRTATQMLSWANMPALQAAPQPKTA
jgi:putative SOS response-associated peptidase YedK